MNRTAIAIVASLVAFALILGASYAALTTLAPHVPPGRAMGMLSAALMVGSGLACAGAGYLASKWAKRGAGTSQ